MEDSKWGVSDAAFKNIVNISCGDASRVEGTWVSPSFRGRRTWPQASQSVDPDGRRVGQQGIRRYAQ